MSQTADPTGPARARTRLGEILAGLGVSCESPQTGAYLVRLEGQHKLATMTWLIAQEHSLHVEAFFCRKPDENHAEFYRFLLERGSRMFGVHFALDPVGNCRRQKAEGHSDHQKQHRRNDDGCEYPAQDFQSFHVGLPDRQTMREPGLAPGGPLLQAYPGRECCSNSLHHGCCKDM